MRSQFKDERLRPVGSHDFHLREGKGFGSSAPAQPSRKSGIGDLMLSRKGGSGEPAGIELSKEMLALLGTPSESGTLRNE